MSSDAWISGSGSVAIKSVAGRVAVTGDMAGGSVAGGMAVAVGMDGGSMTGGSVLWLLDQWQSDQRGFSS